MCAQPTWRRFQITIYKINHLYKFSLQFHTITEPVGSVAPKVDIKDEINYARAEVAHSFALICPAQSYPVPIYR